MFARLCQYSLPILHEERSPPHPRPIFNRILIGWGRPLFNVLTKSVVRIIKKLSLRIVSVYTNETIVTYESTKKVVTEDRRYKLFSVFTRISLCKNEAMKEGSYFCIYLHKY